ncbi:high mobility group protein 20A-like [Planococcus citri]|uniref:high mobility group protein 20A-like n=1 Tax=Planococcus citri TaxID=170843 RepID=UPI0031F86090
MSTNHGSNLGNHTNDNSLSKRGSFSKMKKRKKSANRDQTAPRQPLSGYVRFMNDRRETVRSENPSISFTEITRLLANEWNQLPQDQKQMYLDAAEQEREKYMQEMAAYKQTDAYKQFNEHKQKKKAKTNSTEEDNDKEVDVPIFDIPIFTEEFLEYNKNREAELRQLRKSNTDLEQQNAILEKHLENMKQAVDKLQIETLQRKTSNNLLQQHLQKMKAAFIEKFSNIPLPGTHETPSAVNIDQYISKLHGILQENSETPLYNKVKHTVCSMDFAF